MTLRVELLIIGDELLNGTILERNGAWFGRQLAIRGIQVAYRHTVPDTITAIVDAMTQASMRADLVVTSGGLGPTVDDLTAQAAAQFLQEPVITHVDALRSIEARRSAIGRTLTDADKKQAELPKSAQILANPVGTAPGFSITSNNVQFFHLPGVPHEFRELSSMYVLPAVDAKQPSAFKSHTWKCFGVTESGLATMVESLDSADIELHYRAHFPEIHLTAISNNPTRLKHFRQAFESVAGRRIFGGADDHFPRVVVRGLQRLGWSVGVAESCTGGLVAKLITDSPGASTVFGAGFITYANQAKTKWLGVSDETLIQHGAVSKETVTAMATGVRKVTGATLGIATSGIAGPGGGTTEKKVGSIHIALASDERIRHRFLQLPFDRERNRIATAYGALELIRKHCLEATTSNVETNVG